MDNYLSYCLRSNVSCIVNSQFMENLVNVTSNLPWKKVGVVPINFPEVCEYWNIPVQLWPPFPLCRICHKPEPKAKNWYTYGLLKDWKSRTIISHEKSHSSCAWLIVSKNVDIYNYKWMDWQRSQECSISIFHCTAFLKKEENMDELWNLALVVQDIDYICMWEEKLQSDQFKQCIHIKKTSSQVAQTFPLDDVFLIYHNTKTTFREGKLRRKTCSSEVELSNLTNPAWSRG